MELAKLYKRVVGLDVHQAKITVCAIIEDETGDEVELAEFGGFKRDRQALAEWVAAHVPEMSWSWRARASTGRARYAALEKVGIVATVVNARHVKTVPGRKTDWADAQWLAMLARSGCCARLSCRPRSSGSFAPRWRGNASN
jgi:transposase